MWLDILQIALGFIAGGLSTGTWEGAFTGMLD